MNYTNADVVAALQRLAAVTAGKPLQYPAGQAPLPSDTVLQYWEAVAAVAGDGRSVELPPQSVEQLRVVFNHVETTIISCGAPDSFDVYEACFNTLTVIGAFLQTQAPRELLMKCLEEVNEVYDVLLSCVETYEWVQPGSTGYLRLWMLQVLFACFGFSRITGRHLMELTENDVSGAVSLVSFVLRTSEAPFEMQDAAGRCLVELTTADCVFLGASAPVEGDWQNQQISKLTGMLNCHVNGLIKGIIQFEIIEAFGRCTCQHQMNHAHTDIIVKHFLTTVHNCLLYCSENQKKLRQHLATQSTVVQDIMIPYVHNILPALYENPNPGPQSIEWQNLKSTLQTFVVVTFNINVFRPQLRDADMIPRICQVPNILTHITMLELLIKLAVNVDFVKGPYADNILQTLQASFERLPPDQKARLQRRMTSEQSMRLPLSKSNVHACQAFVWAMTPPVEDMGQAQAKRVERTGKWRNAKNKGQKRQRLFGMHGHAEAGGAQEEEDDSDNDCPPLIPAGEWEAALGPAEPEAGVPSRALCQLTGSLMTDPVQTAEGHTFERAALEDWVQQAGTNPLTGVPLNEAGFQAAPAVQSYIQGYQFQMLSACQIAPEAFDQPPVMDCEPMPPRPPPAPVTMGPSLLGALPAMDSAHPKKKKEKSKIRIESRSVVECPDDMRCGIDGKVMIQPIISPYGHHFEKKTLEKWITNCGSVCPVTQKPMRMEECQLDAEMKKRIVKFLKNEA